MSYTRRSDRSDNIIKQSNATLVELEAALRQLEAYTNALDVAVSSLREKNKDDRS